MDELDHILLASFQSTLARLARDPAFARRRRARAARAQLRNPLRAFCLTLRASDHRLFHHGITDPLNAVLFKNVHHLKITADTVRQLLAPVHLRHPGVHHARAAELLGLDVSHIAHWIRKRALHVRYQSDFQGKPSPYVWSNSPLDPSARYGQTPDPLWKNLWQSLTRHVPDRFFQWVERIPRSRPRPDRIRPHQGGRINGERILPGPPKQEFRGWQFVCPGRWFPVPLEEEHQIPTELRQQLLRKREAFLQYETARAHWQQHSRHPAEAPAMPDELINAFYGNPDDQADFDIALPLTTDDTSAGSTLANSAFASRAAPARSAPPPRTHPPGRHAPARSGIFLRRSPCGLRVARLYCPVPMLTLPVFTGDTPPFSFDHMPHAPRPQHADPTFPPYYGGNATDPCVGAFRDGASRDGASRDSTAGDGTAADETSLGGTSSVGTFGGGTSGGTAVIHSFACKTCWNPIYFKATSPADLWNLFVTHISGGLMTGRDVPRPHGASERQRKHRAYTK